MSRRVVAGWGPPWLRYILVTLGTLYVLFVWLRGVGHPDASAVPQPARYFTQIARLFTTAAVVTIDYRVEGWLCAEERFAEIDYRPHFPIHRDNKESRFHRVAHFHRYDSTLTLNVPLDRPPVRGLGTAVRQGVPTVTAIRRARGNAINVDVDAPDQLAAGAAAHAIRAVLAEQGFTPGALRPTNRARRQPGDLLVMEALDDFLVERHNARVGAGLASDDQPPGLGSIGGIRLLSLRRPFPEPGEPVERYHEPPVDTFPDKQRRHWFWTTESVRAERCAALLRADDPEGR